MCPHKRVHSKQVPGTCGCRKLICQQVHVSLALVCQITCERYCMTKLRPRGLLVGSSVPTLLFNNTNMRDKYSAN